MCSVYVSERVVEDRPGHLWHALRLGALRHRPLVTGSVDADGIGGKATPHPKRSQKPSIKPSPWGGEVLPATVEVAITARRTDTDTKVDVGTSHHLPKHPSNVSSEGTLKIATSAM